MTYSYKEWGALMAEALELKDDAWHGIYYEKGSAAIEWYIDGQDRWGHYNYKWGHYNYNKKCVYPQEGINEGLIKSFINNGELARNYWDYYDNKYNEKTLLLDNNGEDLNDDDYMRYIVSFYRNTAGITVKKNEEELGVNADCMGYIFEIDNKRYPDNTPYQIQFYWADGPEHCISDCGNTLAYLRNKLDFNKNSITRRINTILHENGFYLEEQKYIVKENRENFILDLMTLYSVIEKISSQIQHTRKCRNGAIPP